MPAPKVPAPKAPKKMPSASAVESARAKAMNKMAKKVYNKGAKVVTVKSGDTLYDIAKKNNTTVAAIYKVNPILAKRKADGKGVIFSGSKVRLPVGKAKTIITKATPRSGSRGN